MNQPLGELHPWDRCNPAPVAGVCVPSSQTVGSNASDGQLWAAHTSVLMQGRESNAKSFLPAIFHTALYTSVCLHFTVGNKSYLHKSGTGLSYQPDTHVWWAFLPQLPFALLPRWGGTAGTHRWVWPVSRGMDQSVLHRIQSCSSVRRCEQTFLWDFPALTNPPAYTAPTAPCPQMDFYNPLVKTSVFVRLWVCAPRNSSDSSLLCCTRKWSRSTAFCESAFFFFF